MVFLVFVWYCYDIVLEYRRNIMGYDLSYLVLVLPAVLFATWASFKVKSTFNKYQGLEASNGLTGAMAAMRVMSANGIGDIPVERVRGELTDHFDPTNRVVRLSDSVYGDRSVAAIGVACHEIGHVIQYKEHYPWIKLRNAIIPATNIGSKLSIPLIIIGLILGATSEKFIALAYAGVALYSLSTLFQLITLPVEFNASRRALQQIRALGLLDSSEIKGAQKVLTAAALTYVAALATSLAYLLRFVLLVSSSRRRD